MSKSQPKISLPNYSGEFFDLSIPSTNDIYGFLHNTGVLKYGINFPLEKFIKELEMILSEPVDDKTEKRRARLAFLEFCNKLPELKKFFESFCNYLNGKSGMGEQYTNYVVFTAAGGNIIILFAQLINDMINMVITKITEELTKEFIERAAPQPQQRLGLIHSLYNIILIMFNNNQTHAISVRDMILRIADHRQIAYCIVNYDALYRAVVQALKYLLPLEQVQAITVGIINAYTRHNEELSTTIKTRISLIVALLTPTNRILLDALQSQYQDNPLYLHNPDNIVKTIVYYFLNNSQALNILMNIAISPASDCDFKLSPNTCSIILDSQLIFTQKLIGEMDIETYATTSPKTVASHTLSIPIKAGFLLFRVKSLIACHNEYISNLTPQQIKKFKNDCTPEYKKRYAQTISQVDLDTVSAEAARKPDGPDSNCLKYLEYLYTKKLAIRATTQLTIDQALRLQIDGLTKQSHVDGSIFQVITPAPNFTEGLLKYIRSITIIMNEVIQMWENNRF